MTLYTSQSARDAQAIKYGSESYWAYLDEHALELHAYFLNKGDPRTAAEMLTRSLSQSLAGNDGP
jgi:hypothetical protein